MTAPRGPLPLTAGVPGATARRRDRSLSPVLGLVVAMVLMQRLALPVGASGLPVLLPVTLVALVIGLARGTLTVNTPRLQLFCAAVGCCTLAALVAMLRGFEWSPLSYGYLLATYLPFVFGLRHRGEQQVERVYSAFHRVMTVAAVVALVHFAAQLAGWQYQDLLGLVVPAPFLLHGFNTANPIYFNSPIYRENAVVFLEPSFLSQYLALAVLAHLHLRRHGLALWLLLAALLTTVSGTGLLVLTVGFVALGVTRRSQTLLRVAVPAVLVVVGLAFSPLGSVFFTRLQDQAGRGSSAQDRFVAPYQTLLGAWLRDVPTMASGDGPGAADRLANSVSGGLLAPVVAKILLEYGILGGTAFLFFAAFALVRGSRAPPLTVGLAAAYFVLNAATLVPAVTVAVLALHVWLAADTTRAQRLGTKAVRK